VSFWSLISTCFEIIEDTAIKIATVFYYGSGIGAKEFIGRKSVDSSIPFSFKFCHPAATVCKHGEFGFLKPYSSRKFKIFSSL